MCTIQLGILYQKKQLPQKSGLDSAGIQHIRVIGIQKIYIIYILFKLPPFFEHTFTSLHLFSTPISCLSPFFNHTFCCLPTFSHTFSCLQHSKTCSPLSAVSLLFLSHFQLSPFFLTLSVASSFFSNTFSCLCHSKKI